MAQPEGPKKEPLPEKTPKNENVQKFLNFAKSNTMDTIAYVALFLGIILLFFTPFWGGVIIGAVGGFYFADPIIRFIRHFEEYLDQQGIVRVLILLGVALGFLIVAPAFFVGAAATVGLKYVLAGAAE